MATLPFDALPRVMTFLGGPRGIPRGMKKVMATAARGFGREVVTNTPVDVGDARVSWIASVGVPSTVVGHASPGNKRLGSAKKTLAAGRFADVAASATGIAQHNPELEKFMNAPAGTSFFFSNNQPYIVPLEQGKLRGGQTLQNAPGWVERSINLGVQQALTQEVIPRSAGGGPQFVSFNVRGGRRV